MMLFKHIDGRGVPPPLGKSLNNNLFSSINVVFKPYFTDALF